MTFLQQIDALFRSGTAGGLTDGALLERFLERRDEVAEAAFAALVDRHGAMILRVCRQILHDETDAEDAAQATFLVLARRAGSIGRRESVGSWLHGVAIRVAAKARTAAARRRAHEQRGGAMRASDHPVDPELRAIDDHDDWVKLHNELGGLPRSFREPLVLCYFDGLTQEQAAAQLNCPLGTIQSRLARGRAKLKARLEKRGVSLGAVFASESHIAFPACPAPPAWSESTVRLAMRFAEGKSAAIGGAGTTSAILAEELVRAMVATKLKFAVAMILVSAVLVTGAAAWAMRDRNEQPPILAKAAVLPAPKPAPEPAKERPQPLPESVTRTIRGIVRDEQGRPVAKAWVGKDVNRRDDSWEVVEPFDRIRETKQPFRDETGKIVAAGALGKYFEVRDEAGNWRPIHPADIRRCDPSNVRTPFPFGPLPEAIVAAIAQGKDVFQVRLDLGRWRMSALSQTGSGTAHRTDPDGRFFFEFTMLPKYGAQIVRFASPDFSRQAISVVRYDDPDKSVDITMRPVRRVRARIIETPKDHPEQGLTWKVFAVDPGNDRFDEIALIGESGAYWQTGFSAASEADVHDRYRRFEIDLPPGRYKVAVESDTVVRSALISVPPGDGPLDLPDIRVESTAWFKMLGKAAAEIDAVDSNGMPVTLADFRGKAVVLSFWSSTDEPDPPIVRNLAQIQKKFKGKPLAILALHDSSIMSIAEFKNAVAPFRDHFQGEPAVFFLLDRRPTIKRPRLFAGNAGELGSGRTNDAYDNAFRMTFVIDKTGTMVSATREIDERASTFSIGKDGQLVYNFGENPSDGKKFDRDFQFGLIGLALENLFEMPRSPLPKPKPTDFDDFRFSKTKEIADFQGTVIDLDGKPITGATITEYLDDDREAVTSGPNGEFVLHSKRPTLLVSVSVKAPGFAPRRFKLYVQGDDEPQLFR